MEALVCLVMWLSIIGFLMWLSRRPRCPHCGMFPDDLSRRQARKPRVLQFGVYGTESTCCRADRGERPSG